MAQATSLPTQAQWFEHLQTWAVEHWGEVRAQAIREEIEATAQHLFILSEYPLEMEQTPGFFME